MTGLPKRLSTEARSVRAPLPFRLSKMAHRLLELVKFLNTNGRIRANLLPEKTSHAKDVYLQQR